MDKSAKILSEITIYGKYAKYLPQLKRRETWEDIVVRNFSMHQVQYANQIKENPELDALIVEAYSYVLDQKVLPSMRSLQFAGKPIELSPSRMYNCSYLACDDIACFSETMFLLLGGSGVGYSVQKHHVAKLPELKGPKTKTRRYLIGDSIEGWSDSVKVLLEAYFSNKSDPIFDFRDIRPKGARLITSGGKAPGPQPLKDCLHNIRKVLDNAIVERGIGCQLKTIEVSDIMNYIADAVLAGGIRRAALIGLFSFDDDEMLTSKYGKWWETNPQRARSNISAVALRHKIKKKDFFDFMAKVRASNAGEPGIFFTNDKDYGCNPCGEIALKPNNFCNLVTINASNIESQEDLEQRVIMATRIGTLQAGFTDFHYLRDCWQKNAEQEALLGISMTGISAGKVQSLDMEKAVKLAIEENKRVAKLIGINPAYRLTCVKPEGTTSLVLGCSSGIHGYHSPYYIRRMRIGKNEAIHDYLKRAVPGLLEDEFLKPDLESVLSVPIKSPENAIFRDEGALNLLNRSKDFYIRWVKPGHVKGQNTHNVSITVSVKDNEWEEVISWMWENKDYYNGITVLPYDCGTYKQPPFEDCTKEQFEEMYGLVRNIDLTKVIEETDETNLKEESACSGGGCQVTHI